MKPIPSLTLAASLLVLTGCRSPGDSRVDTNPDAPGHKELLQASGDWDKLYNAGDGARLALLYAEDAISMPPNSPTVRGRKAIQAECEGFFAGNVARHETIVDQFITEGDLSMETARYRLTYKPRAGGAETVETGRHLECRRKINGAWRIVVEIWNTDTPASK